MTPLISIVIPVYNASAEISQCLDSIFRNNWLFFEVIIVDDASTDNSLEIVSDYECLVVRSEKNLGPAHARNLGVSRARADIVHFLDADTELPDNALRNKFSLLSASPVTDYLHYADGGNAQTVFS